MNSKKNQPLAQPLPPGIDKVLPQFQGLILISSPIGNVGDLSPRARDALIQVDFLLAEDTRRLFRLLHSAGLHRDLPVDSFHDHSPGRALQHVAELLTAGKSVGYVCDAGVPGVSDPGYELVKLAEKINLPVNVIPGPSAVTTFFALSGLASPKFLFHGFFPRTRPEIEVVLNQIQTLNVVHIFYESPQRIESTLHILVQHCEAFACCVARELTKTFEEHWKGSVLEVQEKVLAAQGVRGEVVFGILGGNNLKDKAISLAVTEQERHLISESKPDEEISLTAAQREEILTLLKQGVGSKEIAKKLSKKFSINRRSLYTYIAQRLT